MIRPLEQKDHPEIERMIYESAHMYNPSFAKTQFTYVLDDEPKGFFTYMMIEDTPVLQQFYVDPKHRSMDNFRRLTKGFVEKMKGFRRFMISAESHIGTDRFVEYYFKVKPIRTIGVKKFYVIER